MFKKSVLDATWTVINRFKYLITHRCVTRREGRKVEFELYISISDKESETMLIKCRKVKIKYILSITNATDLR